MLTFDHVHVLTLKGVCLDGGPAPYIIMPFMANGSLLAYLRKNKKNVVISSKDAKNVSKLNVLMAICLSISHIIKWHHCCFFTYTQLRILESDYIFRSCYVGGDCM
jgi:serine/threonine protein kinase